jgi:hypothetical protein
MEHITNDKKTLSELMIKCRDLYVFVPYKENPLYPEHVNYYVEDYYKEFGNNQSIVFKVEYKQIMGLKAIVRSLLFFKFNFYSYFSKEIIMYHFKGLFIF